MTSKTLSMSIAVAPQAIPLQAGFIGKNPGSEYNYVSTEW
jgi:hypothetical protein